MIHQILKFFSTVFKRAHLKALYPVRQIFLLVLFGVSIGPSPLYADLLESLNSPLPSTFTGDYFNYLDSLLEHTKGCSGALASGLSQKSTQPLILVQSSEQGLASALERFGPKMIDRIREQTQKIIKKINNIKENMAIDNHEVTPFLSKNNGFPYDLNQMKRELDELNEEGNLLGGFADYESTELLRLSGKLVNLTHQIRGLKTAEKFLEAHPEAVEMANTVNALFQSTDLMALFFSQLLTSALVQLSQDAESIDTVKVANPSVVRREYGANSQEYRAAKIMRNIPSYIEEGVLSSMGWIGHPVMAQLENLAQQEGWKGVVDLNASGFDKIRSIINSNHLFRDVYWEEENSVHTRDGHLVQSVLASIVLNKVYGSGSARRFFDWMGSKNGGGLWVLIFDRMPGHTRDFRAPSTFNYTGFHSFLGLQ